MVNAATNYYACDVEEINEGWQIGDLVIVEAIDDGSGYVAGPYVVTLSGDNPNQPFPSVMTLDRPGIEPHVDWPNCSDEDADYINDVSDNCLTVYNPYQRDADEDGVGDKCDSCPDSPVGQPVGGNGCMLGDIEGDGDVDLADFAVFEACFAGPGAQATGTDCSLADVDGDEDVDLEDFVICVANLTGPI